MAKQTDRQAQLLDTIDALLRQTQEPIHYRELTNVLVDSGLWETPWGKQPDQILYSAIHNDIKRHGKTNGRFMFMGGGIFCTTFVEGIEFLEDILPTPSNEINRDPYRRQGDMPGDAEQRRTRAEAAEANKKCGNCVHLEWHGPNIHTHEIGTCALYLETGRPRVFKCSEACDRWKHRTQSQVSNDRILPRELFVEAESLRITGQRPTRSRFK